jgi:pimeloyl-ACP methyl ester carboxylesterase
MYRCFQILVALAWAGVSFAVDCTGIKAVSPQCKTSQSSHYRDFFYVGGGYAPAGNTTSSIFSDQMYVEKLTPAKGVSKKHPLVFISAGVPSGVVWLNTPDNRKGWASYFLDAGYQVYILDITANGRSGQNDVAKYPLRFGSTDTIHENGFTHPEGINPYPQSQGHTQWPGSGTRGDPIFDAFFAATVPLTSNSTAQELSMRADGCTLLSLIGPSYTICHSAGCTYTALMSDQCPDLLVANLNLEPGNIPFQSLVGNATVPAVGRTRSRPWGLTNTKITYNPPVTNASTDLKVVEVGVDTPALRSCFLQSNASTIRTLPQIAKVPYVMFTAANSPHITYDHCFVSYLAQAGVPDVTWIKFGDLGIQGNGHFFYIELNNLQLAAVVEKEIQKRDGKGRFRSRAAR